MDYLAHYYPAWHDSKFRNGYNEWDILKNQTERYQGHKILYPVEYYDDTNPNYISEEILLAQENGINGFVICTYFDGNDFVLDESSKTLGKVINNFPTFKVCLNISPRLPRKVLPLGLNKNDCDARKDREIIFTINLFEKLLISVAKKILSFGDGYYKIDGNPVIYFFQYYSFFSYNIPSDEIKKTIEKVALMFGFETFIIVGTTDYTNKGKQERWVDYYGGYNSLPRFQDGSPIQQYSGLVGEQVKKWLEFNERFDNKYIPSVSLGFDSSSRGENGAHLPKYLENERYYPWWPIVENFDTQLFIQQVIDATKFALLSKLPFITLCAWNEWTEGCVLLPNVAEGDIKLTSLKKGIATAKMLFKNDSTL